ncbi:hypothetical protein Q7P36_001622 [Cladosporium allicinum]
MQNVLVAASALLLAHCGASPIAALKARQSCPEVHVFGARETTAPAGYGTASVVVDLVLGAYAGATSEAIDYPACGGQADCGGDAYGVSMVKGISAVASAVNAFHTQCPDTKLVLVGYSQGGQIMDNAFCGGPDDSNGYTDSAPAIDSAAMELISAVIEMGSPRFVGGLDYGVGTCTTGGFSARPSGYTCASSAKMQSYCDSTDPYCCDGSDEATHQGYGNVYGQDALTFIQGKLDSASSASTGAATEAGATTEAGAAASTGADASAGAETSTGAEAATGADSTASVPATGDAQTGGTEQGATTAPVTGGAQDAGAQTGAQTGTADQGAGQWGQAQGQAQGQGQWGGWGKKN